MKLNKPHIECEIGDVIKINDCIPYHEPDYVKITKENYKGLFNSETALNGQELCSVKYSIHKKQEVKE